MKRNNIMKDVIKTESTNYVAKIFADGVIDTIRANSVKELNYKIEKSRISCISFAVLSRS